MYIIKCVALCSVVMLLFTLCSCVQARIDLKHEISPSDKSLVDLVTTIYDNSVLLEIGMFDGTINELNAEYPIECLRNKGGIYRASFLGKGSIAILTFDSSGNKLSGKIYTIKLSTSNFIELVKGHSLEDVKTLDPNGDYSFLYTGRNDTPKVSYHYTKDGYIVAIEYNTLNTITSITKELI